MSSTKKLRKVGIEDLRGLMGASAFDKGYRPDLVGTKQFLAAMGTEADDTDIEIILKETCKELDAFENLFDKMFTEKGAWNPEGLKEVFSSVVDDIFSKDLNKEQGKVTLVPDCHMGKGKPIGGKK